MSRQAEELKWLAAQPQWGSVLKVIDDLRRDAFSQWAAMEKPTADVMVELKAREQAHKHFLETIGDIIKQATEEAERVSEQQRDISRDAHDQIGTATDNEEILALLKPAPILATTPKGAAKTEPAAIGGQLNEA